MNLVELSQVLGNFGEFFGAIAVVGTLIFLALQVRHSKESMDANTRSLDASRKLAMAQTYQARAEMRISSSRFEADSEHVAPLMDKLETAGWPKNGSAFEELSTLERRRVSAWVTVSQRQLDNYHYHYQQGLLDEEYWENVIVKAIQSLAPRWKAISNLYTRPSFKRVVDEILAEASSTELDSRS
jgi:hypothetical protein